MRGALVTTIKDWSAIMAMMWAEPMASAGVCTTEVAEQGWWGWEGLRSGELFIYFFYPCFRSGTALGVEVRQCVTSGWGIWLLSQGGWGFSLIGAWGLKPVPRFKKQSTFMSLWLKPGQPRYLYKCCSVYTNRPVKHTNTHAQTVVFLYMCLFGGVAI